MVIKEEPTPHIVIPDTNILWYEDKTEVVNPEFETFWSSHSSNFILELVIPEVVKGELLFQQSTSAIRSMKKATDCMGKISKITGKNYRHKITEAKIKTQVEVRFDKWLKGKGGIVEPAPADAIDWKKLIQDSIWRNPPFEFDPKKELLEKGFRDALTLETVVALYKKERRKYTLAFICDDTILRNETDRRLSSDDRFSAFESLASFESYLKLTHGRLTDKFIKSLISKATAKFFTKGDESCISYKENITERISAEYQKYFDDPTLSEEKPLELGLLASTQKWEPKEQGMFWFYSALFQRIEDGNIYYWVSPVVFVHEYTKSFTTILEALSVAGEGRVLILPFTVKWKAKVTKDGRFREPSIEGIELKGNRFVLPTDEQRKRYNLSI